MNRSLNNLLQLRTRQLGLSLSDVAERAGMTRAYLHRLAVGGTANPGIMTLQRLATALQVPASAIYRIFTNTLACPQAAAMRHEGLPIADGGAGPQDVLIFVADVTVPDHTVILPGERFTKTWALQNAGSVPWTGRRLVRADDELVISLRNAHGQLQPLLDSHLDSLGRSVAVPTTLPGQLVELSVEFAAPLENCSVASIWRLEDAQGRPCFGARCFLQAVVTVIGG
ncbi:MAG TPA: transcriptional regulator [Hydrogenophaga sp.]|uniref:NBR1-Ig-like domain-containing protein n=3 Tax=Hydrogenophaga sp. TaxID=1904254 RepID=UPI0008BA9749|nr:NBR1-Ig-like domain-containing protein [Hydrogenophaga sp.]OGA76026.1 MAG: hypothetical protein A2X73_18745 [Burkholderiales bacterium GWE1_65_30]OGA89823.1 MAG: hypothetical protein A2X72_12230 [Burkholderiales bacterium GWF1_66_17]HAX21011.1 transcriptional regulator [Hydrogenophaga sp.]